VFLISALLQSAGGVVIQRIVLSAL